MSTRIPIISGLSRGGVRVRREHYGIILNCGDQEAALPSFEARELAIALLLLAEEADARLALKRLGRDDASIDEAMRDRAEEASR